MKMAERKQIKPVSKPLKSSPQKVLQFEQTSSRFLTENEITNLFFGLLNLIKKSVVYEKEKQYKLQLNQCNKQFANYQNIIEQKNQEIAALKEKLNNN